MAAVKLEVPHDTENSDVAKHQLQKIYKQTQHMKYGQVSRNGHGGTGNSFKIYKPKIDHTCGIRISYEVRHTTSLTGRSHLSEVSLKSGISSPKFACFF